MRGGEGDDELHTSAEFPFFSLVHRPPSAKQINYMCRHCVSTAIRLHNKRAISVTTHTFCAGQTSSALRQKLQALSFGRHDCCLSPIAYSLPGDFNSFSTAGFYTVDKTTFYFMECFRFARPYRKIRLASQLPPFAWTWSTSGKTRPH